jgi:tyrosyl-DNA phosphodiesterase-1
MDSQEPPAKKRKRTNEISINNLPQNSTDPISLASLRRAITPPPRSRPGTPAFESRAQTLPGFDVNRTQNQAREDVSAKEDEPATAADDEEVTTSPLHETRFLPSPVHLTRIRDLPASSNVDTVRLTDLLSDPMIKELWNFNYLFDLDFVM